MTKLRRSSIVFILATGATTFAWQDSAPRIVTGIVVAAGTGRPLPGATIRYNESDAIRSVPVGADGRFVLTGPRSGRFTVRASAPGYLSQAFGDDSGLGPTPVHFKAGAAAVDLRIELHRGATIAGRVTDESGDVAVKVTVHAIAARPTEIDPRPTSVARTETDDRGQFRLTALTAGSYAVAVARGSQLTFAPASPTLAGATRVTVAEDGLREGVNVRLPIERIGSVTGVVTAPPGTASAGLRVELVADPPQVAIAGLSTRTDASGRFAFDEVQAGTYAVFVRPGVAEGQPAAWGRQSVAVSPGAPASATLALRRGASIEGQFLPSVAAASITIAGLDGPDASRVTVRSRGSGFSVSGLPPGRYGWVPPGMGGFSNAVVAVMRDGQDITDLPLEVADNDVVSGITIRRMPPSGVSGRVLDGAGRPTSAGAVIVLPEDSRYWTAASRRLRVVRADTDGNFVVEHTLPPGRYRLAHVPTLSPGDLADPAFLKKLVGVPVIVAAGQVATADVRVR